MTEFTPIASFTGGVMIGLAAVLLMALEGRIAGISGIAGRLLPPYRDRALARRLAFVAGLVAAPLIYALASGRPVEQSVPANLILMLVAGLLVGFGSAYGNGCTSGHGVCGMARLSKRSVTATLTFMATAFVTVFVVRHVVGA